jgi:hypothetical protein
MTLFTNLILIEQINNSDTTKISVTIKAYICWYLAIYLLFIGRDITEKNLAPTMLEIKGKSQTVLNNN